MLHTPELRAFERTYRAEGPFVAAVLGRLAVPSEAVHDAVQDVFVAAYRRWTDFDDSRPVRPWLTAFAHRVAFRYRRSQARRTRKRAALRHVHATVERSGAERADARAFLQRFLAGLDEGHRRVFVLSELEGHTASEVAEQVGISTEAVYGRVRSLRKRLHRALLEDAREPDARAAALVPPFGLLLPQLGLSSAAASLGAIKAFGVTVALGAAAAIGVVALSPRDDPPPVSAAAEPPTEVPQNDPRSPKPASFVPAAVATSEPEPPPAPAKPTPVRSSAPLRSSVESPAGGSTLEAEAALLRDARKAQSAGRLEDALGQLAEHARRFPDGQLADGRRRARIRVLCDLGRTAQARGEARVLAERAPSDPLAMQALEICAAPIQSSGSPEKGSVQ